MKTKQPPQGDLQQPAAGRPARKIYATPKLIEYGSLSKLTAAGTGSSGDAAMSMSAMAPMCL